MSARSSRFRRGGSLFAVAMAGFIVAAAVPPTLAPVSAQSAAHSPGPAGQSSPEAVAPLSAAPIDLEAPLAGPGVLPTDQASADLVEAIRTPEFGPDARLATAQALASVGVAVVEQETLEPLVPVAGTPSPLRFLDWQVHALALEVWAGGGVSGADLDAATPVPDDAPLASSIVAGWLAAADTPAGRLGRALMAGQDVSEPTALVIPSMVLALVTADIAADRPAERAIATGRTSPSSGAGYLAGSVLVAQAGGGICTSAQRFIDDVIGTVFEALHATPPRQGVGRVVVSIWNWLVDQGQAFVRGLVDQLTAPVINTIRLVAGTLATIAHVVAALVPYSVVVVAAPVAQIEIPPDPGPAVEGTFYVIVSAGDLPDWPEVLADCAQASGVTLPSFSPAGNPIVWGALQGGQGLLFQDGADAVLDERGAGTLRFHTTTEPPDVAQGDRHAREVTLEARIRRRDVEEQRARLSEDLFGRVPGIVRPFVSAALKPLVDGLLERVTGLLEARGRGSLTVIYHTPRATPEPSPTATPPGAVWVYRDRPSSPGLQAGRVIELVACDGVAGRWSGILRAGGIQADGRVIVPFRSLRVRFTPRDGRGRDTVAGTLPYGPLSMRVRYQLQFRIDGSTMRISGKGSATGPGGVVAVEGLDIEGMTLPIEPAPAGKCR
ncbi:hypothetical protein BH23CHL8_BH23CHL8_07810 [soil metagenome]